MLSSLKKQDVELDVMFNLSAADECSLIWQDGGLCQSHARSSVCPNLAARLFLHSLPLTEGQSASE